jgi:hypothetical protein
LRVGGSIEILLFSELINFENMRNPNEVFGAYEKIF